MAWPARFPLCSLLLASARGAVIALALASPARAAGPLGPAGSPLTTSSYALDFFQGPVLASTRITSLAGATAAVAEGVDGMYSNPAAPAVRVPWSYTKIDYDLSAGLTLPSTLSKTDFDNNGTPGFAYRNFVFVNLGATLQAGPFGVGLTFDASTYRLDDDRSARARALSVDVGRFRLAVAYALARGELVFGASVRTGALELNSLGERAESLAALSAGAGVEAGAIYAPFALPTWRFGLAVRSAVVTKLDPQEDGPGPDAQGDRVVAGLYVPDRLVQPWELEAGVAFQPFGRALNLPWDDPNEEAKALVEALRARQAARRARGEVEDPAQRGREEALVRGARAAVKAIRRKAYESLPRRRLLLLASLLTSGRVKQAVGFESFLVQAVDRSGERVTFTPRFGVEAEVVPHLLQVRAGTYLEPSRFRQGSSRLHGTGGLELRLFPWTVFGLWDEGTYWRASGFVDGARDYVSFGLSAGVWH